MWNNALKYTGQSFYLWKKTVLTYLTSKKLMNALKVPLRVTPMRIVYENRNKKQIRIGKLYCFVDPTWDPLVNPKYVGYKHTFDLI